MHFRLTIIIAAILSVWSAGMCTDYKDSVSVNFRQSKVNIDPGYMQNMEAFRHIDETVSEICRTDSTRTLLNVEVIGGASPEGSVKFNKWLSKERANRIFEYISGMVNLPDSLTSHTFLGRDWEGLREMVNADPNVPYRESVLVALDEIISRSAGGEKESDGNLSRLKNLHGGVPYLYMYRKLFPSLRESRIVLTIGTPEAPDYRFVEMPLSLSILAEIETMIYIPITPRKPEHNFYMSLKSNMLSDLLAVPQISAEFYLGKNFSVAANWMYGWWDKDRTHRYWRLYGGDLAFRWWFGKAAHAKPLTGHHVGIYGGAFTFDFEFGGKGYMGGLPGRPLWARCLRNFGVEYGYSLPIARRLNLDFNFGLGYVSGKYIEYEPTCRCYVWEKTKHITWIGPTKMEVSLVWLIGHGNFNAKKGGRR